MPGAKNAATPSCAIASAAAFRTDMNGSSAVDDRTTRIGWRGESVRTESSQRRSQGAALNRRCYPGEPTDE